MNKICVITTDLRPGGSQRSVSEFVNYLAIRDDTEVHLILTYNEEYFYEIDSDVQIHEPVYKRENHNKYIFFLKLIFFIRNKIKSINPDSIYNVGYNSFTVFSLLGINIPLYISNRTNPKMERSVFYKIIRRLMYSRASGIVAQTQLAKEVFKKETGNKNIKVIPNTIRDQNIDKPAKKKNIIISVGRLIKSKGFDLLLEIFAEANTQNWELYILGDGPELENLKYKSKELEIEDQVKFLGFVEDVDCYLEMSKIFAFCSLSEGYPNALLEAMCSPLASISFDCDAGPRDLIDDGVNGYLVPIKDKSTYVERLNRLICDKDLRHRFEEEAKKLRFKHSVEITGKTTYEFITNN